MITVVQCNQCGGSVIDKDVVSVDLSFNKSHWCRECHHPVTSSKRYFFCSTICFLDYITKVVNGETVLEPGI